MDHDPLVVNQAPLLRSQRHVHFADDNPSVPPAAPPLSIEPSRRIRCRALILANANKELGPFDGRCTVAGTEMTYYWDDGASGAMMTDAALALVEAHSSSPIPRTRLAVPLRTQYADGRTGLIETQVTLTLALMLHGEVTIRLGDLAFDIVHGPAVEICLGRLVFTRCGMSTIPDQFEQLLTNGAIPREVYCGDLRAMATEMARVAHTLPSRRCVHVPY